MKRTLLFLLFVSLSCGQMVLLAAEGGDENAKVEKKAQRSYEAAADLHDDAKAKMAIGRTRDAIALVDLSMEKLTASAAALKKIGKTKTNSTLVKNIYTLQEKVNISRYEFRKRKTMVTDDKRQKMLAVEAAKKKNQGTQEIKPPDRRVEDGNAPKPTDTATKQPPPPPTKKRLAIPGQDEQKEALDQIKEVLADEYKKTSVADQRSLATKLLAQADENEDDPAILYTLLSEARDAALRGANVKQAFRLIARLNDHFLGIDTISMGQAAFREAAKATKNPKAFTGLAESALALTYQATKNSRLDDALSIIADAMRYATRAKVFKLKGDIRDREKELKTLQTAYKRIKPAIATLAAKPEDPAANLQVGRYYALLSGNWGKGLSLLTKGGDDSLASLARAELGKPTLPKALVALADAWWKQAKTEKNAVAKQNMTRRSVSWYQRALPNLKGLAAAKAKKRIASSGLSEAEIIAGSATPTAGGSGTTSDATKELKKFKLTWSEGKKRSRIDKVFNLAAVTFVNGFGMTGARSYNEWSLTTKHSLGNFKLSVEGTNRSTTEAIWLSFGGKEFYRYSILGLGSRWKLSVKRSGKKITVEINGKKSKQKISANPGTLKISLQPTSYWYGEQCAVIRKIKFSGSRAEP